MWSGKAMIVPFKKIITGAFILPVKNNINKMKQGVDAISSFKILLTGRFCFLKILPAEKMAII